MRINWKLRFKNPAFWWFVAATIFTNFAVKLNVHLETLTTWDSIFTLIYHAILNPVVLVSTLMSVYLGAVDFTTKGLNDSNRAMNYDEPN